MTNDNTLSEGPVQGWQLRAEYRATNLRGGDPQLAEQAAEALRELNLPPLQQDRIQQAVLQAVQRASLRGQPTKPISQVHIRIWLASDYASGRSSGFFLIERPGCDLQGAASGMECLVELFLYQERDS